jgi:hypothetical protein
MNTPLEKRKTFGIRKTPPYKVKSTNGIYTIAPWSDNKLNKKAAVEAGHKKAEAITILSHSIKIR